VTGGAGHRPTVKLLGNTTALVNKWQLRFVVALRPHPRSPHAAVVALLIIYTCANCSRQPPGDQKGGPEVLVTEVKQPDVPLVDGFVAGEPPCLMLWRLRLPMVQVRLERGLGALAHRITVSQNECANDAD
jgi:hypothetical protein